MNILEKTIRVIDKFVLPPGSGIQYWSDAKDYHETFIEADTLIVDKNKTVYVGTTDGMIHVLTAPDKGEDIYG